VHEYVVPPAVAGVVVVTAHCCPESVPVEHEYVVCGVASTVVVVVHVVPLNVPPLGQV
jgi:hypothetical protein